MKTAFSFSIFVIFTTIAVTCRSQTPILPAPSQAKIIARDANSQVWEQISSEISPSGQRIQHKHHVTEIASGLNYWSQTGWAPSDPSFQVSDDGLSAYANKLQYKLSLLGNLNATNSVQITTPDEIVLKSTPVAIGLYDAASGKSLILAGITNCTGSLISTNQIQFADAFDGVSADILFTLKRGSFSQDIILKQDIDPADYGFPANTTRIQLFTEFFNTPSPEQTVKPLYVEKNQSVRNQMASPDFVDHRLKFGRLTFDAGRAFSISASSSAGAPVAKAFETIDGNSYLVESVKYTALEKELRALPSAGVSNVKKAKKTLRHFATIPSPSFSPKAAMSFKKASPVVAEAVAPKGVDFDYVALAGTEPEPFTLQGNTTYFVSGPVDCDDLTIQGGVVVKYPDNTNAYIEVDGNLACQTAIYRPAVFTAADDDSVGASMSAVWAGYTGTIQSGGYACPALYTSSPGGETIVSNVRILYAQQAVAVAYYSDLAIADSQFIDCGAMAVLGTDGIGDIISLDCTNCLISAVGTIVEDNGGGGNFYNFYNCTIDSFSQLLGGLNSSNPEGADFVNSIFSNDSDPAMPFCSGAYNGFYNSTEFGGAQIVDDSYPFQSANGGNYYLADNTFRGQGQNYGLSELAGKTTWPPTVYSNVTVSVAENFTNQVPRDTNSSPDLGYHYDPIDVAFTRVNATSNLAFTAGIVMGWFGSNTFGIALTNSATVDFNGLATSPCYVVCCDDVQEAGSGQGAHGGIVSEGNSASAVNAQFTRFAGLANDPNDVQDGASEMLFRPRHCEFWSGTEGGGAIQLCVTNSLFDSCDLNVQSASSADTAVLLHNCTMHDNSLETSHSGGSTWPVWIQNCTFDGTAIQMDDPSGGNTNISYCDYNAFLTNADRLPMLGTHDITNLFTFNWQTSWFGDFYLPPDSPLIKAGSTPANLLGLYHFTTQTNQTIEGTNIVTIGYHYVATDKYGNPLDSNGDGIPDYLEDPSGNGSGNWDATMFLNVIITQPRNGSTIP